MEQHGLVESVPVHGQEWDWMSFKVPSRPNHPGIPGFCGDGAEAGMLDAPWQALWSLFPAGCQGQIGGCSCHPSAHHLRISSHECHQQVSKGLGAHASTPTSSVAAVGCLDLPLSELSMPEPLRGTGSMEQELECHEGQARTAWRVFSSSHWAEHPVPVTAPPQPLFPWL